MLPTSSRFLTIVLITTIPMATAMLLFMLVGSSSSSGPRLKQRVSPVRMGYSFLSKDLLCGSFVIRILFEKKPTVHIVRNYQKLLRQRTNLSTTGNQNMKPDKIQLNEFGSVPVQWSLRSLLSCPIVWLQPSDRSPSKAPTVCLWGCFPTLKSLSIFPKHHGFFFFR